MGLDAQGRDCGLGTPEKPFATLAKALALARWGSRIYIRDSIYRHTAMQTTFSLGPDSIVSGFPGHRPTFSPSEFIAPSRWQQVTPVGALPPCRLAYVSGLHLADERLDDGLLRQLPRGRSE